jgi:hypothetical protein
MRLRGSISLDGSQRSRAAHGHRPNSKRLIGALLVALVINAGLLSCTKAVEEVEDAPAVSDAQPLLDEAVMLNSGNRLKLVSVAKTGGRRFKVGDMDGYELWYNADVELTQDALWSPAAFKRFSTLPAGSTEDRAGWKAQPDERYQ